MFVQYETKAEGIIQNFLGGNNFGWSKHHLYLYHKVSVDSNFEPADNMVKNKL